jgi:hypothetical protein
MRVQYWPSDRITAQRIAPHIRIRIASVIALSVIALSVIALSVIALSVIALYFCM